VVFVFVDLFSVYSTVMHRCLYYLPYSCLIMLRHIYVDEINNNNNNNNNSVFKVSDVMTDIQRVERDRLMMLVIVGSRI